MDIVSRKSAGVGYRRHYHREDVGRLLQPHFRVRAMCASGIGLSDSARLALSLFWRWALQSRRGDAAIRRIPTDAGTAGGPPGAVGRGYWLVAAAERLPAE